jgi:hypothetical protein
MVWLFPRIEIYNSEIHALLEAWNMKVLGQPTPKMLDSESCAQHKSWTETLHTIYTPSPPPPPTYLPDCQLKGTVRPD